MARVIREASTRLYANSSPPHQGSMRVEHLREFVRALDEHQVPDDATVTAHHDHVTKALTLLSVEVIETTEVPGDVR